MLSRSPALRGRRSTPYGIFYPIAYKSLHAGSQQLRCAAPTLTSSGATIARQGASCCSTSTLTGCRLAPAISGKRHVSSGSGNETNPSSERTDAIEALIDKVNATGAELEELLDDLNLRDEHHEPLNPGASDVDNVLSETIEVSEAQTVDARVRMARLQFGETLPEGYLNETELLLYTRLYGDPIIRQAGAVEIEAEEIEQDSDQLFREDGRGGWEEVEFEQAKEEDNIPLVYDMDVGPAVEETAAMRRTREVAEQLGGEIMLEAFEDGNSEESAPRLHPLTVDGKFATDPSTVFPPKDTLTGPISVMLGDYSNKHIAEAAHRAFGGRLLPYSTTTPPARAQVPQLPISLDASQRFMSDMEANAYLAVMYPGMYASVLSVLTEVRKRLGSDWLRPLISKEGGPSVLDASAGGAGILAWRDVLRAEWELMVPDHPPSAPYPLGRSTVVTGSDALRLRASAMLEDTSFLPRLPDYVHIRETPTLDDERAPMRKHYDIIIAPHTLLGIEEDYMRKEYVENLWALLNPNGGVLILLEKGHQRGFEAIGGAREMLLKRHISSPGSTEYTDLTELSDESTKVQKEPGMIIAPCTNHERCPMYKTDGLSKGRRDFCHFEQRYIRPPFHQRIIGAKDRNHEDLKFSYLAVQRGVDLREKEGIAQGAQATDGAFEGYEHLNELGEAPEFTETEAGPLAEKDEPKFHTLSLPRVVYPPMKRRGHVIFDLCTPSGKIERWTVPRSYSRQAYKDARKARWGDLWALGAKTRIPRNLRLGDKDGEGKKERLARRAAARAEMEEDGDFADGSETPARDDLSLPTRKKGENIPSWKKHADKKKIRQASKRHSAATMLEDL